MSVQSETNDAILQAAVYNFEDALEQYIDARIRYNEADPEWRFDPRDEKQAMSDALVALLKASR